MTETDELIMVRVSKNLLTKTIEKLDISPSMPAQYIVDTALRELTKEA